MRSKQYDILVVDDDDDDRMVMRDVFDELHCGDRVTFYNGSFSFLQAMASFRLFSPLPLLIVLDYNMPGANGAALLNIVKSDKILTAVPVIIYSTGMNPHLRDECLNAGALAYFEKQQTYTDIIGFAKQLCEYAYGKLYRA